MSKEYGAHGFLRIANEADRLEVVAILYKNGYTVSPARRRKNGKTYEYLLKYDMLPQILPEEEANT